MTIKEAIQSELGFSLTNPDAIDKALIDFGLTGTNIYLAVDRNSVKRATLQVLEVLLSTANVTTSTGPVTSSSTTYDRSAILKRMEAIKRDLGLIIDVEAQVPTVKFLSPW